MSIYHGINELLFWPALLFTLAEFGLLEAMGVVLAWLAKCIQGPENLQPTRVSATSLAAPTSPFVDKEDGLANIVRVSDALRDRNRPRLPIKNESAPEEGAESKLACELTSSGEAGQPFYVEQDAASSGDTAPEPQFMRDMDRMERELVELRFRVRELEQQLATVGDVPPGRMVIRGRLVLQDRHLWVIPEGGKPVKLVTTQGWEFTGEQGDLVLAEGVMGSHGWAAWRVIVEQRASELSALDLALVEKLTAIKPKKGLTFEDLDLDVVQNQVRKASHSAGAVALHIVLPTHARFGLTEDQATDLKSIVSDLVNELDLGRLEALEIGNTDGGRARDHLHLLVSGFNHAGKGIGEQIGRLKALSSGRLRRRHRDLPVKLWSASYWVSSAGGGSLDKVRSYIELNADL